MPGPESKKVDRARQRKGGGGVERVGRGRPDG